MSFRRPADAADAQRRWRAFVRDQDALLARLAIPGSLLASRDVFDHFLMHGFHPGDPSRYRAPDLDAPLYPHMIELVDRYLAAGFPDPGIDVLRPSDRDELRRRHPGA